MLKSHPFLIFLFLFMLLGQAPVASAQAHSSSVPTAPMWIWAEKDFSIPDTVFFRHAFRLPQKPVMARLLIVGDDIFTAYLNEDRKPVGTGNDWTTAQEFDVTRSLKAGRNILAIEVTNTAGPGGLLYRLTVELPNGKTLVFVSNKSTRLERRPPPIWMDFTFDDSNWSAAREIAPVNGGVWGMLRTNPQTDASRIVRIWNILSTSAPKDNPYTVTRNIGDRMLMTTSVASKAEMQILAGEGFTLFQTDSSHISSNEVAEGHWDWQEPEIQRKTVQKLGADWVYFPHFAFPPKWYRDKVPFTRIQCLEHKEPVQAFSPWEPKWAEYIEHGYTALAQAFQEVGRGERPLSALCVGVHGDYGEAGFLSGGRIAMGFQKDDWVREFGNDHDHLGFWCGDPLARANFRDVMLKKYVTLDKLNDAWKRDYKRLDEVVYPEKPRADARREWLDFVEWYKGGVATGIDLNLASARKHFPNTLLMLTAGFKDEDPRGGNDNSLIPKLAAKHKAEVRSSHSAFKPFAENAASMFARLASACRFYKTPFWVEPQSGLSNEEEVGRIFEAVSQGAKGIFDWSSNALRHRDVYYRYGKHLRVEKPIVDVAMFYPADTQQLRTDQGYHLLFAQACAYLRDFMNFDIVDDRMVKDGCMDGYRVLVLWEGTFAEPDTLEKIKNWVNGGGVVLAYDFGKISTFEGDTTWFDDLFGYSKELLRAKVSERYIGAIPTHYRVNVAQPEIADYLSGDWYEPEMREKSMYRWVGANANVLLPVDPTKQYTLTIRANIPDSAVDLSRKVMINGHEIGSLSSAGDVTYRFVVSGDIFEDAKLARLTIQSQTFQPAKVDNSSRDMRRLSCQILSLEMIETSAKVLANPQPPAGVIQRDLDLRQLNGNWSRRYGKGLTIFFPGKRTLLRGFLEVVRRATYNLSDIDPGRRNAIAVDAGQDGVYATLFTDKILYYNSTDMAVTKVVNIPASAFADWRGEVTIPTESSWKLLLEPHSIGAVYLAPPPRELLFECEEFTDTGAATLLQDPNCSPGMGNSALKIVGGSNISTRFRVDTGGQYALYTRCTRNNLLEPVEVFLDDIPVKAMNVKMGQVMLAGMVNVSSGTHKLTIRATSKRDVRADFVLLTSDPTVAGYDFAVRIPPVE